MKRPTTPEAPAQTQPSRSLVKAALLDPETLEVVDRCTGADERGDCPRAHGGVVPCAGMLLDAEAPGTGWELRLQVGHTATACPLRAFQIEGEPET